MKGEDKANLLSVMDKRIISAIKDANWAQVSEAIEELQQKLAAASPSRSDKNWSPPTQAQAAYASAPEKRLAQALAQGSPAGEFLVGVPTCLGLFGDNTERFIDLVGASSNELCFYEFKVIPSAEEIYRSLRQLIMHTVLYRAFLAEPKRFGYNTDKSPLLFDEPSLRWELVAPKDMINPRRADMRWGERDTQAMQKLMRALGVQSFSLSRLQSEAEPLRNSIAKDSFSSSKVRQWFQDRVVVEIA